MRIYIFDCVSSPSSTPTVVVKSEPGTAPVASSCVSPSPSPSGLSLSRRKRGQERELMNSTFEQWKQQHNNNKKRIGTVMTTELYDQLMECVRANGKSGDKNITRMVKDNNMLLFHDKLAVWKRGMKEKCGGDPARAVHPEHVRIVVCDDQMSDVIHRAHIDSGHMYYGKTYLTLKHAYSHVTRDVVKAWCERCPNCAAYRPDAKQKRRRHYRPIHAAGPMSHFTIDLIDKTRDPVTIGDRTYRYIMHGICHTTKFEAAKALCHKSKVEVWDVLDHWFSFFWLSNCSSI